MLWIFKTILVFTLAAGADDWAATGVNFETLSHAVMPDRCSETPRRARACLDALDAVAQRAEPAQRIVTSAEANERRDLFAPFSSAPDFGGIETAFFIAPPPLADEREIAARFRDDRAREERSFRAFVAGARTKQVRWSEAFAYASHLPIKADGRAAAAAAGLNAFYGGAYDARTRWIPHASLIRDVAGPGAPPSLGLRVEQSGEKIVFSELELEGPAERAGIEPGDELVAVNGFSVEGFAANEVDFRCGDRARLSVRRAVSREIVEVTVERDLRHASSVRAIALRRGPGVVALIRIADFVAESTCADVARALERLRGRGAIGAIVDVRGNRGGDVYQGACAASLFVGPGKPLFEERMLPGRERLRDGQSKIIYSAAAPQDGVVSLVELPWRAKVAEVSAPSAGAPWRKPTIMVADHDTASAAEIFVGSLQHEGFASRAPRAEFWMLGERTFGKGTVQTVIPEGSAEIGAIAGADFLETTSRFFFPNGMSNERVGLSADLPTPEKFSPIREDEADWNSLPAANPPWQLPREPARAALVDCVSRGGGALRAREALARDRSADEQIESAVDAVECLTASRSALSSPNDRFN